MSRALIVVRLSNLTDETTSPERQREVCERFCADRGWDVVGVAEDLDVSASATSPFDRPELRRWLNTPELYDVVVFWRVDRLVRRVTHLSRMIEWSEQHGVTLVSATESHFDLSTSIGQGIAYMVGIFAQMEADSIRERTEQAHAHNKRQGKYTGGWLPLGYRPFKDDDGSWRYEPDPEDRKFLHELIDRVLAGERPWHLARDMNERGVPTPQDRVRIARGQASKGSKWQNYNLVRVLRSPALLGQVPYRHVSKKNGKKVYGEWDTLRNEDGSPVIRAEPLISQDLYDRVQKALDDMAGKSRPYSPSKALLLRVIECGVCGYAMYLNHGRNRKMYYRCYSASVSRACGNPGVAQDEAEEQVTELLMGDYGGIERKRRVYDPGEDTAEELAQVTAELTDIAGMIGTGPYRSGPPREKMEQRAEALETRRQVLEATPHRPAGYRYEPTGETFRQYWDRLDSQQRNMFLRDMGVRFVWDKSSGARVAHLHSGDLDRWLEAIDPSKDPEQWIAEREAEQARARQEAGID